MIDTVTCIGCVVCTRVVLVMHGTGSMVGSEISVPYKGELTIRLTTCYSCSKECTNSVAISYGNTPIGTTMITGSSMYKNVARYFGTTPRIYQVGKFNVIESMSTIRRDLPTERVLLVLCTVPNMSAETYDNELFMGSDDESVNVEPLRDASFF